MTDIRMILSDIDGTLLNHQGIITPETKKAIQLCRQKGILFGIATGRPVQAVEGLLKDWGIQDDVDILLGYNGALVNDYTLNQSFKSDLISGRILQNIIEEYAPLKSAFGIFEETNLYVNQSNAITQQIAKKNKFTEIVCDLSRFYSQSVFKMLALNEKEKTDAIALFHQSHPHDDFKGVRSTPNLYEFMNPNISKSHGIETIVKAHGWSMNQILVFGDEMNDFEMIRDCGVGVCMGNGNPQLKALADAVTESNDEDGIAKYLYQHILKEKSI